MVAMPRTTPGARYPHATTAARSHACTMCAVVGKIAERAAAGAEPWGTPHQLPPLPAHTEAQAEKVVDDLYLGRSCRKNRKHAGALSVSIRYLASDGTEHKTPVRRPEGYVITVRVWTRLAGQANIAGRVERGESLSYNPLRGY